VQKLNQKYSWHGIPQDVKVYFKLQVQTLYKHNTLDFQGGENLDCGFLERYTIYSQRCYGDFRDYRMLC
jgi:hypothetical protein